MDKQYAINESRKNTLAWIRKNIDMLKLSNESEEVDSIVNKIGEVKVGGPIGLTREMLEGVAEA